MKGSGSSSNPNGSLAQLVERHFYTVDVMGSSPLGTTPCWWNWYTQQLQNLPRKHMGSSPMRGTMETFTCKKCDTTKPLSEFPKAKGNLSGYSHSCKECRKAYLRDWKASNTEEVLKRNREATRRYAATEKGVRAAIQKKANMYGISAEEYVEVMSKNNGLCEICSERPSVHLDHCHETGNIRGALCIQCNTGLGLFGDNVEKLLSAQRYLTLAR